MKHRTLKYNPTLDQFLPATAKPKEIPLWMHYAAVLDDQGSFNELYSDSLLELVRSWQSLEDLRERIDNLDEPFVVTEYQGTRISKPAAELTQLEKVSKQYANLATQFGLTPTGSGAIERKRKRTGKDSWDEFN